MVGSNPPNHLGDFEEGIRIRALFSRGQCGPCVWYVEREMKGSERGWEIHLILGGVGGNLGM
jgi:hypothetical protein